ncbi:TonB-dependent siderophore receptor [Xylophilus ampelinus]|uniref:Iron complex outermembrane receptor protein n=1 Tax=Xylophilus ampelinus TaxID=54067 RepID=A0A318SY10_9BURK|nr:TonB-dependent siderophore receptor [Xylophilus ampelinus]MCS4510447.1 TonB-dependent siderophore receptor [Xylophilus ampelinus]PYE77900.1 iron complex outermembrane receptor protein [Xylophilus ampelinus]
MNYQHHTPKSKFFALGTIGIGMLEIFSGVSAVHAADTDVLPEIQVTGSRQTDGNDTSPAPVRSLRKTTVQAGALGNKAEIDTPFSSKTISAQDMKERQPTSIDEAVATDSSVRQAAGATAGVVSFVNVRGLLLDTVNGYKVDGLSYVNRAELPLEMVEQVQVFKGLSGFMYGFGSPGGLVNYQLKRPVEKPLLNAAIQYKSKNVAVEHVDIGGRFGEDHRFGYRINGVHESGDTFVDRGSLKRDSLSVALDARLTKDIVVEFDALQSTRNAKGIYFGIFPANGIAIPAPIDGSRGLAEDGAYFRTETTLATTGLKWKINPDWAAKISYRYGKQATNWREGSLNLLNNAGDYTISQSAQLENFVSRQVQATMEGNFQTGPLYHNVAFGLSGTNVIQYRDSAPATATLTGSNIFNPVVLPGTRINHDGHTTTRSLEIQENSAFIADTVDFNDQWSVIAGWRKTNFSQDNFNRTTGVKISDYGASPITPAYAVMYRPTASTTFYTSYVESLEKGGVAAITNANNGAAFGPLTSKQIELGVKTEGEHWNGTAALFQIERGAEYTDARNNFVQSGNIRYRGLELGSEVGLARQLTLSGNAMLLDAKYRSNPALNGNRVPGISDLQVAARLRYAPVDLQGWSFSGGVRRYSDYQYDASNTRTVGGYSLLDIGAQYQTTLFGKKTIFNAVVNNVANKNYWVTYSAATPNLLQGAPRTFVLNMTVEMF